MELEALLEEVSPDDVCGPDLEYDSEFMALVQAAKGKSEQQFGDTVIHATEPDWNDVQKRAVALFARTKDLRVAVLLIRALLRQSDFIGLSSGLMLLVQMLERYWEAVYPRLEVDEDNDPTIRLNVLNALIDPDGLLKDIRFAQLIPPGAYGRLIVRDILVAMGKLPAGPDGSLNASQVEGILKAAAPEHAESISAVRQSLKAVRDLQTFLNSKLGGERALNLQPLTDMLSVVVKTCDSALGGANTSVEPEKEMEKNAAVPSQVLNGEIRTREDSIRLLDQVCEFMERTEPSNPAPLLIRRAQRLISKNFIEIIEDLAPDSLGAIKGIAGLGHE